MKQPKEEKNKQKTEDEDGTTSKGQLKIEKSQVLIKGKYDEITPTCELYLISKFTKQESMKE